MVHLTCSIPTWTLFQELPEMSVGSVEGASPYRITVGVSAVTANAVKACTRLTKDRCSKFISLITRN